MGIYCHDKYMEYGTCLQGDLIRSRSGDLNPGPPGTKQPLYHLSHQPLIGKTGVDAVHESCPQMVYIMKEL